MKYSVDKNERYVLFRLEEEKLNTLIAPALKSEFVLFVNEGVSNLILDLSAVKFVDSSGLSAILTGNRLWKDAGSFILTGIVHENVVKLIKISRVDGVLKIIPTASEAIDFVLMEEVERELKGEKDSDDS